jgi:large subunit ribosomal protein L19
MDKIALITRKYLKEVPEIRPGMVVRVTEKIKEGKNQTFEGIVIARKHGKGINATFTLRGFVANQWVEKIYPLHSPNIEKIEILKVGRTRRAKLYFIRELPQSKIKKKLKI